MSGNTAVPRSVPETGALTMKAVVGFLIFVELTSGFVQGFYIPLFGTMTVRWGINDADITWFISVWTLSSAVSIPILAKLGDMFGHRRILRIAVFLVLLGVCFVAFSQNYSLVLIGRALTGPLSVWLPLEIALIHDKISGDQARKSVGLLISSLTIGSLLGMLAAGALSSLHLNFTVVLLAPAVVTALCAVVVVFLVPESSVRAKSKIDLVGFIGLGIFMILLLVGLSGIQKNGFGSVQVLAPLAISLMVLGLWIAWELRREHPAINLRLVGSRAMWPPYLSSFMLGTVLLGTQTVTTTFLATRPDRSGFGFGLEPGRISLISAALTLVACVGAAIFAYVARGIGIRGVLILGACMAMAANLLLIFFHASFAIFMVNQGLNGLGFGMILGALPSMVAELSPRDQTGIATGIYNSLKTLGGAVGGAVFGVILAATIRPGLGAALGAYQTVWGVGIGALAISVMALMFVPSRHPEHTASETDQTPAPLENVTARVLEVS
ncbi:MFS transporter [Arthrobacter dokdonensis]|uniref:MFS transporter n=1 Tax=Arthrobacter dokdonellae TaxID=2211210 RepID=UPI000DE5BD76|nr:MFS transporter [Arthrobacter dokdonellae]